MAATFTHACGRPARRGLHALGEQGLDGHGRRGRAGGQGGRIITVASDAGRVGSSGEAVYSGCKGGVIAFGKTIAREVARYGITSNCVCPGPTDTPPLRKTVAEGGERYIEAM